MVKQTSAARELVLVVDTDESDNEDDNQSSVQNLRKLRQTVEALRIAMSEKILRGIKECRTSCKSATNLVGDLSATIKQNPR